MAFKEAREAKEKIRDISEAEQVYESRDKDIDPEKAQYLAIYENMARTKADSYEEYLNDKDAFLEKEYSRRENLDKLEDEFLNLDADKSRTEGTVKELSKKIEDRRKYLKKKVSVLAKMKIKIDTNKEDLGALKGKNKKLEEKLNKLTDSRGHQKLREKYENYIRENNFDIKDKEEEIEKLRKHNVEEKFKRTWEDIWALDERERTLPDYRILERELKIQLKEDRKEVERREVIRRQFEDMEKAGVTPDSIRKAAEKGEETLSKLYDEQEEIREAVRENKKFSLLGKTVAGVTQTGLGMLGIMLRRKNRYQKSENLVLGLFKLRAGAKGLLKNRATIDRGVLGIPSLKEVREGVELYKEPKEEEKKVSYHFKHEILTQSSILVNEAGPDMHPKPPIVEADESLPVIEAEEQLPIIEADEVLPPGESEPIIEVEEELPVIEAESEPIKIKEKDDEIDIADKVSNKIFAGMTSEYTKYLESNSEDDKGINAFFKAMKKAGIKPSLIKKEGRYIKRWMKGIQKWAKEAESLDRRAVKRKMSDNFFSAIVKIHSAEDLKKTGVIRDITGDMFKQYLLIRRLKALEQ